MNPHIETPINKIALKGPIIVDIGAVQSPMARGRGIAKYILNWSLAIEEADPYLVSDYLLDPDLPPPGEMEMLLATGKVRYMPSQITFSPTAKLFHCLWPLDEARPVSKLMPPAVKQNNLLFGVVVYDMIMVQDYKHQNLVERRNFCSHLEIIRNADLILTLSDKVKDDVCKYFSPAKMNVTKIGAAADRSFFPLESLDKEESAREFLKSKIGAIKAKYILCPTGSHPRKNNERLIKAFLAIDKKVRDEYQLVFSGNLPSSMINHFKYMAAGTGDEENIVATGPLGQDILVTLYQCADLVVFPSLLEGFGLPITEALACGTPVIASDIAPFDELLDKSRLFNPNSTEGIKNSIITELTSNKEKSYSASYNSLYSSSSTGKKRREENGDKAPQSPAGALPAWPEIAKTTIASLTSLISRKRRLSPKRKKHLAIVTPLPPATSGIADYSYKLITELDRLEKFSITTFSDGPLTQTYGNKLTVKTPGNIDTYQARALPMVEGLLGGFDQVLYCFGNSHHHLGALASLKKRPGIVLAHDVRLTNLYRHHHGDPGIPQTGLLEEIKEMYGLVLEKNLCNDNEISPYAIDEYGLLLARQVIEKSTLYLVHSLASYHLAQIEAGPLLADKINILPFAMERGGATEEGDTEKSRYYTKWLDDIKDKYLICHFGIVDPIKNPQLVIEAIEQLNFVDKDVIMAFVGPIDENLLHHLQGVAKDMSHEIKFTGEIPNFIFEKFLQRCDLAIQLRKNFNGEASAAIGNTMSFGVPTIVTNQGWTRTLPDDSVLKVENNISAAELSSAIQTLLLEEERRAILSQNSISYSSKYSFSYVAEILSDIILETC